MAEVGGVKGVCAVVEPELAFEALQEIGGELHTMSQPMTALLCSLEIGSMVDTLDGYREAVRESLVQCDRLMRSITAIRASLAHSAGAHSSSRNGASPSEATNPSL